MSVIFERAAPRLAAGPRLTDSALAQLVLSSAHSHRSPCRGMSRVNPEPPAAPAAQPKKQATFAVGNPAEVRRQRFASMGSASSDAKGSQDAATQKRRSIARMETGIQRAPVGKRRNSDVASEDLKRFHPSVVLRVRGLQLAKTDLRVRLLLLFEDWSSPRALALRAVLALLVVASVVLLVLVATVGWSSPDHDVLSRVDLAVGVALFIEWITRVCVAIALRCSRDATIRSLAPHPAWFIVDGVASSAHVITAALTIYGAGQGYNERAVDMVSCLRILRLISLARNSSMSELVFAVLYQSSQALTGPIYFLAVSTVFFGVVVFYTEILMSPDNAGFDTLGNAIWYSWVTFSTVGYGDLSPTTWPGKVIAIMGIASGMLWFAMPIAVVGSTFQSEWDSRNVRVVAHALQTELLENGQMTHDLYKKFLEIDVDGSGELDENEFAQFLASHHRLNWISAAQARAVFMILDPNSSGYVSYNELLRAVFPAMGNNAVDEWGTYRDAQYKPRHDGEDEKEEEEEGEEEPPMPATYHSPRSRARPGDGVQPRHLGDEQTALEVKAELEQLKEQVGQLHAGQEDLQRELGHVKAGQEQMMERFESFLTVVEKLLIDQGST